MILFKSVLKLLSDVDRTLSKVNIHQLNVVLECLTIPLCKSDRIPYILIEV